MESSKLQIILHCGRGLTDVKSFGTMNPYVIVWVAKDGEKLSKLVNTDVSQKGASSPVWECPIEYDDVTSIDKSSTLLLEIKHNGKWFDRDIGQVEVPFKDFLTGEYGFGRQNVSYPVKISSGEYKGEIILSHNLFKPDNDESDSSGHSGTKKMIGDVIEFFVKEAVTEVLVGIVATVFSS